MPAVKPKFENGPITFEANVNIMGGQLVEPDSTTGRIKPTTANTTACLGQAIADAAPATTVNNPTTDTWGNAVSPSRIPPSEVAVAYRGVWRLKVAAATTTVPFGALVKAAANGEVQLHSQGGAATYDMIIGRCVQPGGITAGNRGAILLTLGS